MIVRRGMGATCAESGPIPPGYLCSDTGTGGSALITKVGAAPSTVVTVNPSGPNTVQVQDSFPVDTPLTCAEIIAAGADVSGTDCAPSGLPGWLIPAAIAALIFGLMVGRNPGR